jgi:hypothetical protein
MLICKIKISVVLSGLFVSGLFSQTFIPQALTDQTPTSPLTNPVPSSFQPRYMSGLGSGNTFQLFFEDRTTGGPDRYPISFVSTITGPEGLSSACTVSDISETHFLIKAWPITHKGTEYAYRAWGSHGNDTQHEFYVSNDLTHWVMACKSFTIPNATGFVPLGYVYYGFHDIMLINGTYYAFAEANSGETFLARSANADSVWEAFARVGGTYYSHGPLAARDSTLTGWKPSGNFIDLGYDRGIGKIFEDPAYQYYYLAINTAAKTSLPQAELEAAFIDPANWTWHDGTKGKAANPIFSKTGEHNFKELWVVPPTNPDDDWVIMYIGDFGSGEGSDGLGHATLTPPDPEVRAKVKVWLEGSYVSGAGGSMRTDLQAAGPIPTVSPYSDGRDAGSVPGAATDWVQVELRETPSGSPAAVRSFFLKSDGSLIEPDGSTDLTVPGIGTGGYYVVVRHRNHCAVMSADTVGLDNGHAAEYDFRDGAGRYYGSGGAKELEAGVWGLWAGDVNQDKNVTTSDYTLWYNSARLGESGYKATDINMDGVVTTSDYTMWYNNARLGAGSKVP